jgi:regulator of protease activity HflC (stomatin/prohibitin superfamily)
MAPMRNLSVPSLVLLLAVACNSPKGDSKPSTDDAAAKKAAEEAEEAKKIEERRQKREAEEAAKVAAEAERKQQMEALCIVPEGVKKPKKLDKACEDLAQAQMDYFARQYAEEPETLEKMKATAPLQKANILKMCTGMDVALGLKHAFDNAPMGFASSTNDLIATCMQKLATEAPPADAALPKKKKR